MPPPESAALTRTRTITAQDSRDAEMQRYASGCSWGPTTPRGSTLGRGSSWQRAGLLAGFLTVSLSASMCRRKGAETACAVARTTTEPWCSRPGPLYPLRTPVSRAPPRSSSLLIRGRPACPESAPGNERAPGLTAPLLVILRATAERAPRRQSDVNNGGWLNPDVQIVYDERQGFQALAADILKTPFKVATCPIGLTISHLNLDPTQTAVPLVASPLQKLLGTTIEKHVLSYLLLVEQMHLSTASRWYPYLACLPHPREMTTPVWYTDDELENLEHTAVLEATRSRKAQYLKEHAAATLLMKEHEDLAHFAESTCTFTNFLWAATIMTSRAFISKHIIPDEEKYPNFSILFPVIDLLNHRPSEPATWNFEPLTSFTLEIHSDSARKDAEICNNYGPKMNDELLLGYGFCITDNPFEQFVVKFSPMPDLMEYIRNHNWLVEEYTRFEISTDFLKEPPETRQFLRTKNNLLGRYANMIPFFRGIPPRMVHICLLKALWFRDTDPVKCNAPYPGARITLDILISIYSIVKERCEYYPYPFSYCKHCNRLNNQQQTPTSDEFCKHCCSPVASQKMKWAKIYRNEQAKVIHKIKRELGHHLIRMLNPPNNQPITTRRPLILGPREVIATLQLEFPAYYFSFASGLKTALDIDVTCATAITTRENELWIYILIVLYTLWADSDDDGSTAYPTSIIYAWMHNLADAYPLVANPKIDAESKQDCKRIDQQLDSLSQPGQVDNVWNIVASLNTMDEEEGITATAAEMDFRLEVVIWAHEVVRKEHVYFGDAEVGVREDFPTDPRHGDRMRLYLCPYGTAEEWVFEEVPDSAIEVPDLIPESATPLL
ncbi:SET domain-containing protein [Amniculicola lignicola CBS 123094]|uniref:SET domain-containing protein n=1 Tax=Amniculicola lignicola CBS 123094 TaxID=1392246 RepID=A0A6A5WBK8_9PLEO|nr:SET domain-containing protein [Amniculicola lignicola CBS 123094]